MTSFMVFYPIRQFFITLISGIVVNSMKIHILLFQKKRVDFSIPFYANNWNILASVCKSIIMRLLQRFSVSKNS